MPANEYMHIGKRENIYQINAITKDYIFELDAGPVYAEQYICIAKCMNSIVCVYTTRLLLLLHIKRQLTYTLKKKCNFG